MRHVSQGSLAVSPVGSLFMPVQGMMDFWDKCNSAALAMTRSYAKNAENMHNLFSLPPKLGYAFLEAEYEEMYGAALPPERMPDFSAIKTRFPDVEISSHIPDSSSFIRVWNFDRAATAPGMPTFLGVSPNSGNTVEKALGMAETFLAMGGNARLVQYLDPRRVAAGHKIDLETSSEAVAEIARLHPGCWLAGPSHGGLVAALAAAKASNAVAGLIVIGSPINPQAAYGETNRAAEIQRALPEHFVTVGNNRVGIGRRIMPGGVMQIVYRDVVGECCGGNDPQVLPAELISGPNGMLEWYRRARLEGLGKFKGHVVMVMGKSDDDRDKKQNDQIVPWQQTAALKAATPRAASHDSIFLPTGHYGLLEAEKLQEPLARVLEPHIPAIAAYREQAKPLALAS